MGIPVRGPGNSLAPDSVLKNKSNSIVVHHTREGYARDEWKITYINTHDTIADSQTKPLPYGEKRVKFYKMLLEHIYVILNILCDVWWGIDQEVILPSRDVWWVD